MTRNAENLGKSSRQFKVGDMVVYPAHGVGELTNEEKQVIAGVEMSLYVITFAQDKMVLRVPKSRAQKTGLRHLSSSQEMEKAVEALKLPPQTSRGMWTKRATEYEGKINSGDIASIAEVLRDLHKNINDPDRSYSERIIYEDAMLRFASEYAVIHRLQLEEAKSKLAQLLTKDENINQDAA
jgi:CarD family transcriptional regulator